MHRVRTRDIYRASSLNIPQGTEQGMHVRKLPTEEDTIPPKLKGTGPQIVPVSTSQTEKPYNSWGHWVEYTEGSFLSNEK